MRSTMSRMSTRSSNSMTTPEPSVAPAARAPSKVSGKSSLVRRDEDARRAAEQHCLQRPSVADAARAIDERLQRDAERHFVDSGPNGATRDAEQLRAGRLFGAGGGERRPAVAHDVEHVDERLDVVDDGRLAEQARLHGERRLVPRLAAEALDRVEERRLFAADVGAGAAAQLDVEAEWRVHHARRRAGRALRACASAPSSRVVASGYSPRM